ncbi:MAG TPA: hypothetical protein ENI88_05855 [Desulfobulbus sp.]|nr:hypothetical protein [Desulfobulbus sp.]
MVKSPESGQINGWNNDSRTGVSVIEAGMHFLPTGQQADKPSTSLDPRLRGDDDHWGIPDNR